MSSAQQQALMELEKAKQNVAQSSTNTVENTVHTNQPWKSNVVQYQNSSNNVRSVAETEGLGMYNPGIFMHLHLLIHPITSLILLRKVMGRGRGRNTVLKIFRKYILQKVMRVITTEEENRGKLSIFFPMEIDTADQLWEEI